MQPAGLLSEDDGQRRKLREFTVIIALRGMARAVPQVAAKAAHWPHGNITKY